MVNRKVSGRLLCRVLLFLSLAIVSVVLGFPLYWIISSSLKPRSEIAAFPPTIFPNSVSLENYVDLFGNTSFAQNTLNSVLLAASVTLLTVLIAGTAAYALSRFKYRFSGSVRNLLLISYMFPPVMLALGLFIILAPLGLTDSLVSLIMAHLTITVPFGALTLWPFFDGVSVEVDEAASIDGASRVRTFVSVILPAALPGIIAVAVISFVLSWEDFTFAFFLVRRPQTWTMAVAISNFLSNEMGFVWGRVLTATALMVIPPLVAFALLQDRLMKGFGALRGD
jgi:ABC-type glycerol-3-phosphate transport system permease component